MMQSELTSVRDSGSSAREAGETFHSNPHLMSTVPTETPEQWRDWESLAGAWADGWLARDAGRDKAIAQLMRMRFW